MASSRLQTAIDSVSAAMRNAPASGLDPIVLAHQTGLDEVAILAGLGVLLDRGQGSFVVQVLNGRGQPVREFPSMSDTPDHVIDDYGEEIDVEPRNTRIVFRPTVLA